MCKGRGAVYTIYTTRSHTVATTLNKPLANGNQSVLFIVTWPDLMTTTYINMFMFDIFGPLVVANYVCDCAVQS